jgi:hypothetical protein
MNDHNIDFGSLYWFTARTKSCFKYNQNEDLEGLMLFACTPFVPLEISEYPKSGNETIDWYKLKILTTDGEIWFTDVTQEIIEAMELVTEEQLP